jgi:transcriptional repressor NrdR
VRCPFCGANDDKVVDSRPAEDATAIRRRRECLACSQRYTTYERIEELLLLVRKRSGATEPFDAAKLMAGLDRAASNRVGAEVLAELVVAIEEDLRAQGPAVRSDEVGMAVLERLRALDPVAYLRFASVYKGFDDVADFEREVGELRRLERLEKTTAPKRRGAPDAQSGP